MLIQDFKTEQWMNDYENMAVYNMTDTCIQPLSYPQLVSYDTEHLLDQVVLDYGTITGDTQLKEEILKLYRTGSIDQITLFHGCLEANIHVMEALLSPGDTVIAFVPGYQQFYDYPSSLGCRTILIPLLEEYDWQPDMVKLEEAMEEDVRMMIINNPSNPTGTFFNKETLLKMISLVRRQNTWILCDEVYQGMYEEEYSISDLYEYGIATSSLSKIFSLAGLRIGWVKANASCIHLINTRRDYTIISTGPLTDTLAKIALRHHKELSERGRNIVETNKEFLRQWLKKHTEYSIVMPQTGTVGFLKYEAEIPSTVLAKALLTETGIFFVPGSCFDCEYHLRIGFTAKTERFRQGLEQFSTWMNNKITAAGE